MVIFTVLEEEEENYRKLPECSLCLLLIQRGGHPYLGDWALPGGFVRPGETTKAAAKRELREETGLDQVYLEQLYTFSDPGRDPRTWVMSCAHMALIDGTKIRLKAGDDADNAQWFKVSLRLLDEHVEYCRDAGFGQVKLIRTQHLELELVRGRSGLSAGLRSGSASRNTRRRRSAGSVRTTVWPLITPKLSWPRWNGCAANWNIRTLRCISCRRNLPSRSCSRSTR